MSNYKEGLDSILQAINNLITPQLVNLKYDKTFRGKVVRVIDNGVYEVQINGVNYTLPYAGILNVDDVVKVKSPLNNFSDIYIEAIGGSGGSGSTTNYNDLTNKPILNTISSSSLSPNSSEIMKGTIELHKVSKTGKYSDLVGLPSLDFIPNSQKGVANGIATLGSDSKIISSQLPNDLVIDASYVHTDNNFTNDLLNKLNGIENGAQVNKIESITRNSTILDITNKTVNIEVPTKLSELENDNNTVIDANYVHTDNNFTTPLLNKLNGIEAGAEVNAISGIKVNGILQPIREKIVSVTVPTKTSQLTNDGEDGTNPFLSNIPIASGTALGGIIVGDNLTIDENGKLSATGGGGGTSDYNALSNLPSINGVQLKGNKTPSDLNIDTNQLTNGAGFITKSDVPTKTSELTNDGEDGTNKYISANNIMAGTNVTIETEGDNVVINSTGGSSIGVIDSLSSTSTTDALSANQGKVLNDKISAQKIEGDATGSYNSGVFDITRRGCLAGRSDGSTDTFYYQFAYTFLSGSYIDNEISFKVSKVYGGNANNTGILTAHVRCSANGAFEQAQLRWEYANNGIDPNNFILTWSQPSADSGTIVYLWLKNNAPYVVYHFDVIAESNRTERGQFWTLFNSINNGSTSLPSGYTQVVSSYNNIKVNNIYLQDIQRNTTDTWVPVLRSGYLDYTKRQIVSSVSNTGYPNNQDYLATLSFLSWWNGSYNGSASNLKYSVNGEIQGKPVIAYSNASGTSGTVTLSASSASYKHIRITYKNDDDQYNTTTVSGIGSAQGDFFGTVIRKDSSNTAIMINSALFGVIDTTITISRNSQANITFGSSSNSDTNKLYITKVELWN